MRLLIRNSSPIGTSTCSSRKSTANSNKSYSSCSSRSTSRSSMSSNLRCAKLTYSRRLAIRRTLKLTIRGGQLFTKTRPSTTRRTKSNSRAMTIFIRSKSASLNTSGTWRRKMISSGTRTCGGRVKPRLHPASCSRILSETRYPPRSNHRVDLQDDFATTIQRP